MASFEINYKLNLEFRREERKPKSRRKKEKLIKTTALHLTSQEARSEYTQSGYILLTKKSSSVCI
jgi:hypothetical protein